MTLKFATFAVAAVAALSAAAPLAQAQSAKPVAPAAVQAGAYGVEASHTRVMFAIDHMGFSTWYGDFTKTSGTLNLDPANPANSRVDVRVATDSISTTNAKLDAELKGADWLDAAKYPAMTFVSRKVTVTGEGKAEVEGDLTLHGVTKPVTLTATFHGAGANPMSKVYTTGFDVRGQIKRSDFGVTKYVPLIGDEVTLIISAAFERKAG